MDIKLFPPEGFLEARLSLPLSKSMSARALIISALTPGAALPGQVAECDDTDAMLAALSDTPLTTAHRTVNVGAAGTTMRFLTAYYACTPGCDITLDGSERMRQRPIKVLVEALRQLGADISYEGEEGFPPLRIRGQQLRGGELELDASVSSQYISALLMTAPVMEQGLKLTLLGEIASRPYILMTLKMMRDHGVESDFYLNTVTVPAGSYKAPATPRPIEGDWSAAAAWYEIVALSAGMVSIAYVTDASWQGHRRLAAI
ncbi:MAG: 3-phosphoshikimate 1-carboxyvinyltransferase, partial [Duncaniella sp.]|nr:3-phosphoshikimate 1-carboxyvinyltransferase [Duncaniella sp.]